MSVTYITAELRRIVLSQAEGLCEYCLLAAEDTFFGCEADHIISEKHGGSTEAGNLAMACVFCNQAKGSDLGSIHRESNVLVRFFNPRTDYWADHFELVGNRIVALTPIGEVTARILRFNVGERLLERRTLQDLNRYPTAAVRLRMQLKEA